MNLSSGGLFVNARQDHINSQLYNSAVSSGRVFDAPSPQKKSLHEIDKQAEDNTTFLFEYRALLNSKLTTLITSLTSAYTTDLDASMGSPGQAWYPGNWGAKNAMQGVTGAPNGTQTRIDPGATRSAVAYLETFNNAVGVTFTGTWEGTATTEASTGSNGAIQLAGTDRLFGTTTFLSGGSSDFFVDRLTVDFRTTTNNRYANSKGLFRTDDVVPASALVGNNFEMTLYKFFARPENLDVIRFGLFQDVFVVGTSSLPTGSQVQGSLKLNWNKNTGQIDCSQERYAAFFHS